jgi:hypothetical protein
MLSPGSFSEASINGIDSSGVPWLFVVSRDERFMSEITASLREISTTAELLEISGRKHATDIIEDRPDVAELIAVWLDHNL